MNTKTKPINHPYLGGDVVDLLIHRKANKKDKKPDKKPDNQKTGDQLLSEAINKITNNGK